MGKKGTGTKYHCPEATGPVGDITAGKCRQIRSPLGGIYCQKHEMPCRVHPDEWQHLKNQDSCRACLQMRLAKERQARSSKANDSLSLETVG